MVFFKIGMTSSTAPKETYKKKEKNFPQRHPSGAVFDRVFKTSVNRYLSSRLDLRLDDGKKVFHRILTDSIELAESDKIFIENVSKQGRLLKAGAAADSVFSRKCADSVSQEEVQELDRWPDLRFDDEENNDFFDSLDQQEEELSVEFPPCDAPEIVKKAWNRTMAAIDAKEQFAALYLFMAQSIIANLKIDNDCEIKGFSYPGDPDYKNVFSSELKDWVDLIEEIDEYLDLEQEDFPHRKERIDTNRRLINAFRINLFESSKHDIPPGA